MTLEVSHLVVDGCSLTYCQGLEKPWVDGWPALLAKKIGVPVVNLALGGSGNDAIHRRQYDYFYRSNQFYKSNNLDSKPLHILGLTFAGRREEYFAKYYHSKESSRYYTLDLTPDFDKIKAIIDSGNIDTENIPAYIEYGYFLNFNISIAASKKLETWASLINLYKTNNIKYLIGDYIPTYDEKAESFVKREYIDLYNFVYSDSNYAGKLPELTKHLKSLPCGHDDLDAQPIIADHFYDSIIKQHGMIIAKPLEKIYTLKNYYTTSEKMIQIAQYNEWLTNL